jgi:putative peptidoglycan lipid II flippase
MTENTRTMRRASMIGTAALGGAAIGFLLQLLVAYYFGAGSTTDAYFMAQSTSELLSKLLLGGSVAAVFLPLFVKQLAHDERDTAWNLALNLFHITAFLLLVVCGTLAIFADQFITFIAPGFADDTHHLAVSLLRLLIPSFALLFLVDLGTAMLHALQSFTMPALLRIVAPVVSVLTVAALHSQLGIHALALGTVLGALIQLVLVFGALVRHGFRYRFIFKPRDPAFLRLLRLVYPFIAAMLVTQAAGIVYRILVSDLVPGSLSALKYAEKITQLSTIIFLSSITTVIFPLLSHKAARRDFVGMQETIASAVRLVLFITLPLIAILTILREPLLVMLFQRGSFTPEATALTSSALLFLSLGLAANGVSSVFGHATLALQKTGASVVITIASHLLAIILFIALVPRMSHAGLALASSLVPVGMTLMYGAYLARALPKVWGVFWQPGLFKIVVLTILLIAILGGVLRLIPAETAAVWRFLIPALLGGLLFTAGAWVWRIEEVRQVVHIITKRA